MNGCLSDLYVSTHSTAGCRRQGNKNHAAVNTTPNNSRCYGNPAVNK